MMSEKAGKRCSIRIAGRVFSPRLWAIVLYLAVFAAMVSLGRWQLQRAAEKIALGERAEQALALPPLPISEIVDFAAASNGFRRVTARGQWETSRQLLWDNRAHAGHPGFEAITPLRLEDGRLLLVNRGWLPLGPGRDHASLPDISIDSTDDVAVVAGLLSRPSKGFASGDAVPADGPWPRLLQFLDYEAVSAVYGEPVIATLLQPQLVDPGSSRADTSYTALSMPWLLQANWQPAASGPEKHYGYAFQWFAMATALSIVFVVVNLSSKPTREANDNPLV